MKLLIVGRVVRPTVLAHLNSPTPFFFFGFEDGRSAGWGLTGGDCGGQKGEDGYSV